MINLYRTGASSIPFGAVPARPTIDKIIMAHNKSASQFGINRTVGGIESLPGHCVVLHKKELVCAEPRIVCPRTVALGLAAISGVIYVETLSVGNGFQKIVIGYSINPSISLNTSGLKADEVTVINPDTCDWRTAAPTNQMNHTGPGRPCAFFKSETSGSGETGAEDVDVVIITIVVAVAMPRANPTHILCHSQLTFTIHSL